MSTVMDKLNQILDIKQGINNAIINKGQTTTNFYSYPAAISNIQTGDGMLLYNTLEEMNQATNMEEGDYALVYNLTSHNIQGLFTYNNNNSWEVAKTGLTATNEYVWQNTFWGANGVDVGTLQVTNNLTKDQVKIKAQVYSDLSELTLDPSITDLSEAYAGSSVQYVPKIITNNVSNVYNLFSRASRIKSFGGLYAPSVVNALSMFSTCYNLIYIGDIYIPNCNMTSSMFWGCTNLIHAPNVTTSRSTGMYQMFYNCRNLVSIENIDSSNATSIRMMFQNCFSLREVPNLDTSNVTDMMYAVFDNCYNLISAPYLNTSKVNYMAQMFSNCYNLIDMPQYNTLLVNSFAKSWMKCNNLSDASIQNIINMCLNSNVINANYKSLLPSNSYSPFYSSNISNDRYQNRWTELTAAGWTY